MSTVAVPTAPPAPAPPQPPSPNSLGGMGIRFKRMLAGTLAQPGVLRPVFAVLRGLFPVLKVGNRVVVSRHADVLDVLTRDQDFTISQVNGPPIDLINGPFILSMDRGPTYERDHAALRMAARYDDLPRVRAFAREHAEALVEAAKPAGELEVVQGLTRLVPTRIVAEYFGVPGPDQATLQRWLRNLFQEAFANPIGDPFVKDAAVQSCAELKAWILPYIAKRRAEGVEGAEDVIGRLIAMGTPDRPWADDDWVRRNIAGLIVGAVDTTSRFSILALDWLLRHRAELVGAQDAARAGDVDRVRQYLWEATRFNPHTPIMARYIPKDTTIGGKKVPAGAGVLVGTLSAMFDKKGFPEPRRFRLDRDVKSYLNMGWGMHQCFGLAMNVAVIPEIMIPLLRLRDLHRAPGADGRVQLDGPFPNRLVLRFN